jgi:hypothetical protein
MASAASVLVCALELLSGSIGSLPPIYLVGTLPNDASIGVEGFVRLEQRAIFIVTTSPAFRAAAATEARCGNLMALRKIASIVVHEHWHLQHGADERGAYQAQLMALMRMNAGPGTPVYDGVARSMRHVLADQRQRERARVAGGLPEPPVRTAAATEPPVLNARVDPSDRGH